MFRWFLESTMVKVCNLGLILTIFASEISVLVIAEKSYLFTCSKLIRPGADLIIHGIILVPLTSPVDVTFTLEKGQERYPKLKLTEFQTDPVKSANTNNTNAEPISTVVATFKDGQKKHIKLQIPDTLPLGEYDLKIAGRGGLTFEKSTQLDYESKSHSIFIQTDKGLYRPGQTVQFRIFGLTQDLKIVFEDIEVRIYDANENKISQWKVTRSEVRTAGGIFENKMLTSDSLNIGAWKIVVVMGRQTVEKTIYIDNYVLPKFEAFFNLPPFGLLTDTVFEGKISAKYTFGKPVNGLVSLRITSKWPRASRLGNVFATLVFRVEQQFPINGTATFSVPMKRLLEVQSSLDGSFLVFEANVTETLTNTVMFANTELQFFGQRLKLTFPDTLPKFFKPGMDYFAVTNHLRFWDLVTLKISEQDETIPTIVNGKVKVNVTFYKDTSMTVTWNSSEKLLSDGILSVPQYGHVFGFIEPSILGRQRLWWPKYEELLRQELTFAIPADGIVEIPLNIPSDVKTVTLKAEYNGILAHHAITKAISPSASYIQLRLLTDAHKTGDVARFQIESTDTKGEAVYQVMARGNIVTSGTVDISSGLLKFSVTSNMAPKAKLILYCVKKDGEIVADALFFNVQGMFDNKVSIYFNTTQAEPKQRIQLSVKADPGSKVNVLVVDRSLLLLEIGNDITLDRVTKEIQSYEPAGRNIICNWFCWRWPLTISGSDVNDVFKNTGVAYITDALVYQHRQSWNGPVPMMMAMENGFARQLDAMQGPVVLHSSKGKESTGNNTNPIRKPIQNVGRVSPETWLWKSQISPKSGVAEFEDTVPDTVTSWMATAFAVHTDSGLGLSESAANLPVSKPFLVSLHMPSSVIRGEKVIIRVNIFNYNPYPLYIFVKLMKNADYDNIHHSIWGPTTAYPDEILRLAKVKPNGMKSAYFPIIPREVGSIDIKVKARSEYAADTIQKKILVKHKGIPEEHNVPILIDLKDRAEFSDGAIPISFPTHTVKGSERVHITATGDIMGPSINNLGALLKMPVGCGEQNMVNFAPSVFITRYLTTTNNLNSATRKQLQRFLFKGYQRELTYQHGDGSFSAFGNRDAFGSMWLSSFVLKCFVQAKPYIDIDDSVIHKTINWILRHQNDNGTFEEPGKILNKEMQGGFTTRERALTSFVLIALLESRRVEGVNLNITRAITKAVTYLENDVTNLTDVYQLTITGYALTLAGSSHALNVTAILHSLSTDEDMTKYWVYPGNNEEGKHIPLEIQRGKTGALTIEMTSYVLLSLVAQNDKTEGFKVFKWLVKQRNANGGYSSTQDTIVALQAMAEMASQIYSNSTDMTVTVTGPVRSDVAETFVIKSDNSLALQSRRIASNTSSVTVSAAGHGLGLVEVAVFYNINTDRQSPFLFLNITLLEEATDVFKIQACTRWLGDGTSGMVVMEVGIPSGFASDNSKVSSTSTLKRVEKDDRKTNIYLDEIGKNDICITLSMERSGLVALTQPVPVKVYDYYQPLKQITKFYVPEVLRTANICDICTSVDCDFCQRRLTWF